MQPLGSKERELNRCLANENLKIISHLKPINGGIGRNTSDADLFKQLAKFYYLNEFS